MTFEADRLHGHPLRDFNMTRFRTVLLTSASSLALCGGVAQAQPKQADADPANAGDAGPGPRHA